MIWKRQFTAYSLRRIINQSIRNHLKIHTHTHKQTNTYFRQYKYQKNNQKKNQRIPIEQMYLDIHIIDINNEIHETQRHLYGSKKKHVVKWRIKQKTNWWCKHIINVHICIQNTYTSTAIICIIIMETESGEWMNVRKKK